MCTCTAVFSATNLAIASAENPILNTQRPMVRFLQK